MSFISPEQTAYKDGPGLDAFGRLRVSSLDTLFQYQPGPTDAPIYFDNYTSGTGSYSYSASTITSTLSTGGTASGARALRQTRVYWRYAPGKSMLFKFAATLAGAGTPTGKAEARKGFYDDNNGAFFGRDATGYYVATRTNVTGSVVTNKVYQLNWNVDTLGAGPLNPSGQTVDFTKVVAFAIDFQGAGIGRTRFAIIMNGVIQIVHQLVTNVSPIATLNLPIRSEVINDGGTGANISLHDYSCAIEHEDGATSGLEGGYQASLGTKGAPSASLINSTTLTPILTLRCRDTFNGSTYRGHIHLQDMSVLCKTNDIYWEWIWNAATITGASYNNVDATYSGVEYDLAATAYTGGVVVQAGYAAAGQGSQTALANISSTLGYIPGRTYANVRDTLTLAARGIGGAATAYVTVNFREQF